MFAATEEKVESTAVPVCLYPWSENPYRLVSLWDMFTFDSGRLVRATQFLTDAYRLLERSEYQGRPLVQVAEWDFLLRQLPDLLKYCDEAPFPMTKIPLERIQRLVDNKQCTADIVAEIFGEAARRLRDEAGIHTLLQIPVEQVRFYKEPRAGWEEVIARFPDTVSDIEEVNICFALERHAACVFHCVQTIEVGLIELGKFIGVNDPKSGWTAVTGKLSTLVTKTRYPNLDPLYQTHFAFLEQMHGAAGALNTAWRNKISHAQGRLIVMTADFSPRVAEEIMIASRGFMRRLATDLP